MAEGSAEHPITRGIMTTAVLDGPEVKNGTPAQRTDRYQVSIEEYAAFRRDGFLVVRNLVSKEEIAELKQHTEDLMEGRLPQQQGKVMEKRDVTKDTGVSVQGLEQPPPGLSPMEKAQFFCRLHMLHRKLELHERYMLHPRVLDVLEVIIGPDVAALQTMLFIKPPGKPGQGWHQDSFYIPTSPDSLCGAWIAIDDCDEQNGAMWMAKGSGVEPIYPPCPEVKYGRGDRIVGDIKYVKGISDPDDSVNTLTEVADKYDQVLVSAKAGDVVFFNGHILHRSKKNWSTDRMRRSFVSHYCNARSFTQWGQWSANDVEAARKAGEYTGFAEPPIDPVTKATNACHILARGDTHLPFAKPRFGTPCAALEPAEKRAAEYENMARMIQAMNNGLLGCALADPNLVDDDDDEPTDPKSGGGY
jgi:ectoine hydroxylase-related dioxygenase (phytanoyl-CoA dioxygenase family)